MFFLKRNWKNPRLSGVLFLPGNPANSCIMVVLGHGICLGTATFVSADLGEKKI